MLALIARACLPEMRNSLRRGEPLPLSDAACGEDLWIKRDIAAAPSAYIGGLTPSFSTTMRCAA